MYEVKVKLTMNHVHLFLNQYNIIHIYFYDIDLKNIPFKIMEYNFGTNVIFSGKIILSEKFKHKKMNY